MRSERVQDILHEVVSLSLDRASGDGACLYLLEDGALQPARRTWRDVARIRVGCTNTAVGREALDKVAASYLGRRGGPCLGNPRARAARVAWTSAPCQSMPSWRRCMAGRGRAACSVSCSASPPLAVARSRGRTRPSCWRPWPVWRRWRSRSCGSASRCGHLHAIDRAIGSGRGRGPGLVFAKVVEGVIALASSRRRLRLYRPGTAASIDPAAPPRFTGATEGCAPALATVDERELVEAALRTVRHDGGTRADARRPSKLRRAAAAAGGGHTPRWHRADHHHGRERARRAGGSGTPVPTPLRRRTRSGCGCSRRRRRSR